MTRVAEIVLFLVPFIGFALWRLSATSDRVPAWVVPGFAAGVLILLMLLLVMWWLQTRDAGRAYVPARLENGRVIPGHPAQ